MTDFEWELIKATHSIPETHGVTKGELLLSISPRGPRIVYSQLNHVNCYVARWDGVQPIRQWVEDIYSLGYKVTSALC